MPGVEFADVEAMCIAFAKTKTTAHVATKVPKERPTIYARVHRTGGAASNRVVDNPRITVTVGGDAPTLTLLTEAQKLRHAFLHDSIEMPLVRGVTEFTGLYGDPDPDTGGDRYTFTVEMRVRARRTP